mgnify:CR=1 FL=1
MQSLPDVPAPAQMALAVPDEIRTQMLEQQRERDALARQIVQTAAQLEAIRQEQVRLGDILSSLVKRDNQMNDNALRLVERAAAKVGADNGDWAFDQNAIAFVKKNRLDLQ